MSVCCYREIPIKTCDTAGCTKCRAKMIMHLAIEKGPEGNDVAIMLISKDENKSYQIADAAGQTVLDVVKRVNNIKLYAFMKFKYSCINDPIAPEMARELKAEYDRLEYAAVGFVRKQSHTLASATLSTDLMWSTNLIHSS